MSYLKMELLKKGLEKSSLNKEKSTTSGNVANKKAPIQASDNNSSHFDKAQKKMSAQLNENIHPGKENLDLSNNSVENDEETRRQFGCM